MREIENGKIVAAVWDELAKGNTAPFVETMAEGFAWRMMGSGEWGKSYEGTETARAQLWAPLFAQFETRYTSTASNIFADGDYVIVETEGAVTTKRGMAYNNKYCLVIRMENGKMREVREYQDTALCDRVLEPLSP